MTFLATATSTGTTHPNRNDRESSLGARILSVHRQLESLSSLEPGPVADAAFSALVTMCRPGAGSEADVVLADPRITRLAPRIRQLCSEGEYLLERFWARKITATGDAGAVLSGFPYLANYCALTRLEVHAVSGLGLALHPLARAGFLGGGPLPLSALLMSRHLAVPVDVVDRESEAAVLAGQVVDRLAPAGMVTVHRSEATDFAGLAECDLVVLAALVGADGDEKRSLLRNLHEKMRPRSVLVIRSAQGLRTLLYPAVDIDDLEGWEPLAVIHPLTDVVNSVVVAVRR